MYSLQEISGMQTANDASGGGGDTASGSTKEIISTALALWLEF